MKVLIYTHEFPPFPGGLATESQRIATGFTKAGLDVTVLAPRYSKQDKEIDAEYNFRVKRMTGLTRNHGIPTPVKEIAGFFSLQHAISGIKADLVIMVTREAHAAGGLLNSFPFKVVAFVAGYEAIGFLNSKKLINKLIAIPMRRLYMRSSKIICPSYATKELFEQAGIDGSRVQVINHGMNCIMLSQMPNEMIINEIKSKLNIKDDEKIILTISRVVRGKGQESVIKSIPMILKEYTNFKYLVVGDGSYMKNLKNLVKKLGIESKVIFTGNIPHKEVINYYDLSDLFVLPNVTFKEKENIEGLPIVIYEAMSRGKPVITGIPGGGKEIVEDGVNGYVVNGENFDEISKRLIELLKNDTKVNLFGSNGKKKIAQGFTEEMMINNYLNTILNLN